LWNDREGVWMGWERKRGKLHELNRWLRGDAATSFLRTPPGEGTFPEIRYVVTLDADTLISRGAAFRLAGAMAHPLNRPRRDPVSEPVFGARRDRPLRLRRFGRVSGPLRGGLLRR
jgi:cyclic beta-1,2-glucan synthetase